VLIVEIDPGAIAAMGGNAASLISWLETKDYRAHTLNRDGTGVPIDGQKILEKCGTGNYLDILFLHDGKSRGT
jgi:hypothetical protein